MLGECEIVIIHDCEGSMRLIVLCGDEQTHLGELVAR